MKLEERRPVHTFLHEETLNRIVDALHRAAGLTEPKTPGLRRLTIGLAYADLVRESLMMIAEDCGVHVFHGNPTIYGIGDLRLIHYSVHPRMDTFVSNHGKHLVDEHLKRRAQPDLPQLQTQIPERLRGHLTILATELEVGPQTGGMKSVSLKHAFIGFPARVSEDLQEIIAWETPVCELTSRAGATMVEIEQYEKIGVIRPRHSDQVDGKGGEVKGEK